MITLISNGNPLDEISIKSLSGYLEYHNIPTCVIYLGTSKILSRDIIEQILKLTAGSTLVGFSLMSKDLIILLPIIKAIRDKQKIPVILGGIHPTALPGDSLKYSDFVCVGEGEEPLRLLYRTLAEKTYNYNIPNIGYKSNKDIIINPTSYFVESLDDLPFPNYNFINSYFFVKHKNNIEKIPVNPIEKLHFFDRKNFYFYSQRGCRLSCSYCSNSLYKDLAKNAGCKWYRLTSVKRVKNELKAHLKSLPFIEQITINDDDFLARNLEELQEISSFLKNELKIPFTINGIPSYVTEEKVSLLVKNGLKQIAFGVQTGSDRTLKEIYKRPIKSQQVLNAAMIVAKFYNQGLAADYGFILDNPYENDDDWRFSLNLLISLPKPRTISLYSLQFFPGTMLTKKASMEGYIPSQSSELNKDYRNDIRYSYANTLFFLYSYFEMPSWLNKIVMSDVVVSSWIAFPVRYLIKNVRYLIKNNRRIAIANRDTNKFTIFIMKLLKISGLYAPLYKLKHYKSRYK